MDREDEIVRLLRDIVEWLEVIDGRLYRFEEASKANTPKAPPEVPNE